jgi:advillin
MSEHLAARAERDEALAAVRTERAKLDVERAKLDVERGKRDEEREKRDEEREKRDEERGKREKLAAELALMREALLNTSNALQKKNLDYLRIKGTVDIRSAMGE